MARRPVVPARRARPAGPRRDRALATALDGLRALVDALGRSARAVEQASGLSNAQLFLLQHLAAEGPLSVGQLASLGRTQQSTVSLVVKRLERAGLVARESDPEDGRRVVLSVTAAGRRRLRRAPEPPTAQLLAALAALSPRELDGLAIGCQGLCLAMGLELADAPMLFEPLGSDRSA